MKPGKLDLIIYKGATFSRLLRFKDSGGALIDLTGCTFRGNIRNKTDDPVSLGSFTFVVADQTTNKGEVTMSMSSTNTILLPSVPQVSADRKSAMCAYDVERVNADTTIDRVLEGRVQVSPEVTI